MGKARIKATHHTAVYHCISRIVGGEFLLDDPAKETFRIFMWQQADFAGLQVLTYCLMTNHYPYRYSGYGEALSGAAKARAGLLSVMGQADWDRGAAEYRMRMYVEGGKAGESGKAVFDRAEVLKVLRAGGVIDCGQALRLRIRYFGDGLVLGSERYVNEIFQAFRSHFGSATSTAAFIPDPKPEGTTGP